MPNLELYMVSSARKDEGVEWSKVVKQGPCWVHLDRKNHLATVPLKGCLKGNNCR